MIKMKRSALLYNTFFLLPLLVWSSIYHNPILAGLYVFVVITSIFEYKKYYNIKLYLVLIGAILVISLILTFIQLSSPSYQGNTLLTSLSAVLFIFLAILAIYDYTHDYKISKILQMRNVSPLTKNIIAITLLIIGSIVGLLIGIYYFKI